jgi:hypothetical protein
MGDGNNWRVYDIPLDADAKVVSQERINRLYPEYKEQHQLYLEECAVIAQAHKT